MLGAKFRFHGYGALKFLFGQGRTFRLKSLSIRVAHNPRRHHSRVAVVVSKKVIKISPGRNTARRRIYEIIRTEWANIAPSQDIMISINDPHFLELSHSELRNEVRSALIQAGIWVNPHVTETA